MWNTLKQSIATGLILFKLIMETQVNTAWFNWFCNLSEANMRLQQSKLDK